MQTRLIQSTCTEFKVKIIHIEYDSFPTIVHVWCGFGENISSCSRVKMKSHLVLSTSGVTFFGKVNSLYQNVMFYDIPIGQRD